METSIGILARNNDNLWKCRDLLDCIEKETGYKLRLTLTKDRVTAWRGMGFNPGGYDILILLDDMDETMDGEFIRSLFKKKDKLIIMCLESGAQSKSYISGVMNIPDWEIMKQVLMEKIGILREEYHAGRMSKKISNIM